MSPLELKLAYRAALRAVPDFRFGHDQLVRLLSALPPPPADAPIAFRHRHLRGIIQEMRALDPVDPLDATLFLQIMASRRAAADCAHRSLDPTLAVQNVARLFRCMEVLERSTRQTERMLKKQRAERAPVRQASEGQVPGDRASRDQASRDQASGGHAPEGRAPAQVEFDVEALDAAWRDMHYRVADPVVDPVVQSGGPRSASGVGVSFCSPKSHDIC
jgi:hypothetical protein